jgi:glycosyltransferase involved in cell wall biosynthesis
MKILMIGADPSFRGDISKVEKKFKMYIDSGHEVSFVDVLTGVPSFVADSKVKFYCFGGKNKILALVNTFVGIWKIKRAKESFGVVTTQDLIYSGLLGLFAGYIFKAEVVPQVHGDYVDNPLWIKQSKLRHLENLICKFVLSRVKYVRTVSKRINKDLEKYTSGKNVLSSPIGANFDNYFPQENIPEKRNKQIMFCGRLIEEKNPFLFCEIAKKLLEKDMEYKIVITGSGILEKELRDFFFKNNLLDRLEIYTSSTPEKIREYYQTSLCYVHTALWEGWGIPMIEAIACGCPVLTTDSGCAGEAIIDGVNGFILPPEANLWVDKILELDKNIELQKKFSQNGLAEAKNWSLEYQTKKLIDFLYVASKK